MSTSDARRQLLLAGLSLFLLGLITGLTVGAMANPRAGLAAHLEALMNGMFLMIVALAWEHLRLSDKTAPLVRRLLLFGAYANWLATLAAGVLGTSKATPIAGAGHSASAIAEYAVLVTLVAVALAMVVALGAMIRSAAR